MADNNSHTDNRTPPPGIKVIGKLPPGTPWWDADELGFPFARRPLAFFAVFFLVVAVAVWLRIDFYAVGDARFLVRIGIVAVAFLAVMFVLFGITLLCKLPVAISRNRLERRALSIFGISIPSSIELSRVHKPREFRQYLDGESICHGIQFDRTPDDPYEPPLVLNAYNLVVDPKVLVALLTYRIAKAKGENPPPPEFS